ncbi:hypothetical protein K438DRAFT_1280909 [Mycena galopus ATCC 62051]|nr:hypothetical protein K438DRAFT_1280909 [Mycena galopus ATCC 62051]
MHCHGGGAGKPSTCSQTASYPRTIFKPAITNFVVNDISAVSAMLADLEADRALVAQIQARILELERSLADLRAEQTIFQRRLDSYRYPVLTLPNEITTKIFVHCLPIYPMLPPMVGVFSPTFLTQICRQWREVALATPSLWRTIGITFSAIDPTPKHNISRISDAASRSGSYPIWISLNEIPTSRVYPSGAHPCETLSTLIPHRARWEYLTVRLHESSEDVLRLMEGPIPLLRHLELFCGVGGAFQLPESPQLHSVVLTGSIASRVVLPWAQLTSLTLRRVDLTTCLAILQQTGRLVHCTLELPRMNHSEFIGMNSTLQCLESLTLRNTYINDAGIAAAFFAALAVPALHRLEFEERLFKPDRIHWLASFIAACNCKEIRITECVSPRFVSNDNLRAAFPSVPKFSFE